MSRHAHCNWSRLTKLSGNLSFTHIYSLWNFCAIRRQITWVIKGLRVGSYFWATLYEISTIKYIHIYSIIGAGMRLYETSDSGVSYLLSIFFPLYPRRAMSVVLNIICLHSYSIYDRGLHFIIASIFNTAKKQTTIVSLAENYGK